MIIVRTEGNTRLLDNRSPVQTLSVRVRFECIKSNRATWKHANTCFVYKFSRRRFQNIVVRKPANFCIDAFEMQRDNAQSGAQAVPLSLLHRSTIFPASFVLRQRNRRIALSNVKKFARTTTETFWKSKPAHGKQIIIESSSTQ